MTSFFTGSDNGKAGLNVKKTDNSVDVNGVSEIQLASNLSLVNNGGGSVTVDSSGGGGGGTIGGTIANGQIAVGTGADTIGGSSSLQFSEAGGGITMTTGATGNDPLINMSSSTKAITLKVETNQKLSVDGGVNKFIFDASSGTGGITFPDTTIQTSAALPKIAETVAVAANTTVQPASTDSGKIFVCESDALGNCTIDVVNITELGTQLVIMQVGSAGSVIITDSGGTRPVNGAVSKTFSTQYTAITLVLIDSSAGPQFVAIG